jgi:hypothetical protein
MRKSPQQYFSSKEKYEENITALLSLHHSLPGQRK